MSDTPRTDEVIIKIWGSIKPFDGHPVGEIARTLERELTARTQEVERLREELRVLQNKQRVHVTVEKITAGAAPVCNCPLHHPGFLAAGWYCPVHGQQW